MNKIYKVVWSKVKNCYVVVSEIAKNVISGSIKSAKIGSAPVTKGLALGALMAFMITGSAWAEDYNYSGEKSVSVENGWLDSVDTIAIDSSVTYQNISVSNTVLTASSHDPAVVGHGGKELRLTATDSIVISGMNAGVAIRGDQTAGIINISAPTVNIEDVGRLSGIHLDSVGSTVKVEGFNEFTIDATANGTYGFPEGNGIRINRPGATVEINGNEGSSIVIDGGQSALVITNDVDNDGNEPQYSVGAIKLSAGTIDITTLGHPGSSYKGQVIANNGGGTIDVLATDKISLTNYNVTNADVYAVYGENGKINVGTLDPTNAAKKATVIIDGNVKAKGSADIDLKLETDDSVLTGAVITDGTNASTTLTISNCATWNVTGDSNLSVLNGDNAVLSIDLSKVSSFTIAENNNEAVTVTAKGLDLSGGAKEALANADKALEAVLNIAGEEVTFVNNATDNAALYGSVELKGDKVITTMDTDDLVVKGDVEAGGKSLVNTAKAVDNLEKRVDSNVESFTKSLDDVADALSKKVDNRATGQNAIAMGFGAKSEGSDAVAVGWGADASNFAATAIGREASASGHSATAIGENANAKGTYGNAIGYSAVAGTSGNAIGAKAQATGDSSIAIGSVGNNTSTQATGVYAIAIGSSANAYKANAVAVGQASKAGMNSIAIGQGTIADDGSDDSSTVAIGLTAQATGNSSTAVGRNALASENSATAFGAQSKATGFRSTAIGYSSKATGKADVAIGTYAASKAVNSVNYVTIANNTYAFYGGDANTDNVIAAFSVGGVTTSSSFGASETAPKTIYRQLQYVAAGQVSETSTDAVNGSQLHAAYKAIDVNAAAISSLSNEIDNKETLIKENQDAINVINNTETGILAQAKADATAKADAALSSANAYTDGKISDLANGAIANNTAAIAKNAQDIATVNSNLVTAIDTINQNVAAGFEEINKNVADGFNAINGGITENKEAIENNANKISVLETKTDGIQTDLSKLNTEVADTNNALNQVSTNLANLNTAVEEGFVTLNNELDKTNEQVVENAQGIAALENKTDKMQTDLSNLNKEVVKTNEELQKTNANVTALNNELVKTNEHFNAELDKTNAQVVENANSIASLENATGNMQADLSKLNEEVVKTNEHFNNEIQKTNNHFNAELDKTNAQLVENTNDIAALDSKTDKMQGDLSKLNEEVVKTNEHFNNEIQKTNNHFNAELGKTNEQVGVNAQAIADETEARIAGDEANAQAIAKETADREEAISGLNQRLGKMNGKINKVGAGAAALAALHPLEYDPDDKLTFSAGVGNYNGENAAALGAFYRPDEKLMFSLGGTMGNGENMVNLGVSIGLDGANGTPKLSRKELVQKVSAMEAENQSMKAEIAELKALVAELVNKK